MTEDKYVALRPFRFGTDDLQIGDPVPVEAGRDYRLMQRLGQIGLAMGQIGQASVTAPAGQQAAPPLTPFQPGDIVVFVADDGAHTLVTFIEALEAPEEVREGLGLEAGALVATVTFPQIPDDATFVPLDSLLPEQPTRRLIEDLTSERDRLTGEAELLRQEALDQGLSSAAQRTEFEGRIANLTAQLGEAQEGEASPPQQEQELHALQGRVDFLELFVQAIRAEGKPLAADTPALKDLQHNGILTDEGLRLLAAGETGRANLEALDRVGEKKADQVLTYLFPEPSAPATPEG